MRPEQMAPHGGSIGCINVDRVNHPAHRCREREDQDPVPGTSPYGHHGRELTAPRPLLEGLQFGRRGLAARGRVDRKLYPFLGMAQYVFAGT
jgi:hypothetical protein